MLYIMRHGRTDWNQQRRIQGRTDIPLNDEGREMARKAAEEYKDVHFDKIGGTKFGCLFNIQHYTYCNQRCIYCDFAQFNNLVPPQYDILKVFD